MLANCSNFRLPLIFFAMFAAWGGLSSPASAQDFTSQCNLVVDGYIQSNRMSPSPEARAAALALCVSGLENAQKMLKVSTGETMARCEMELNQFTIASHLRPADTQSWAKAMSLCANGDMVGAQQELGMASLKADQVARVEPPPQTAPVAPVAQAQLPWSQAPTQPVLVQPPPPPPPPEPTPLYQSQPQPQYQQPAPIPQPMSAEQCLPSLDRYVQTAQLAPAGAAFQQAVELCAAGRMNEGLTVIQQSSAQTHANCDAPMTQFVTGNNINRPSRMTWATALDLCANGKLDAALGELRNPSAQAVAPRPVSRGASNPAPRQADLSQPPAPTAVQAAPSEQYQPDATNSRALCVGDLKRYENDNKLAPGDAAFKQATDLCAAGHLDAAIKLLDDSNKRTVAKCESELYRFATSQNIHNYDMSWVRAMRLCANDEMEAAKDVLRRSGRIGNSGGLPPSDSGAPSSLNPQPYSGVNNTARSSSEIQADAEARFQSATPAPVQAPAQTAVAPPPPATDAAPSGDVCTTLIGEYVTTNKITPTSAAFTQAVELCRGGDMTGAQTLLFNSNSETSLACKPTLEEYRRQMGVMDLPADKWNRAMVLCADGYMDQAKSMITP